MTGLQWGLVVYGALQVFAAIVLDGKEKTQKKWSGTSILIGMALMQWLMWYAGAWN